MHCVYHDFLQKKNKNYEQDQEHANSTQKCHSAAHQTNIYESYCSPPFSQLCFQLLLYFNIGLLAAFRLSFSKFLFSPFFQKIRRICVISLTSDVVILVLPLQFVTPEMLEDITQDCSLYKRKRN